MSCEGKATERWRGIIRRNIRRTIDFWKKFQKPNYWISNNWLVMTAMAVTASRRRLLQGQYMSWYLHLLRIIVVWTSPFKVYLFILSRLSRCDVYTATCTRIIIMGTFKRAHTRLSITLWSFWSCRAGRGYVKLRRLTTELNTWVCVHMYVLCMYNTIQYKHISSYVYKRLTFTYDYT
jgi:hypothetical protein